MVDETTTKEIETLRGIIKKCNSITWWARLSNPTGPWWSEDETAALIKIFGERKRDKI